MWWTDIIDNIETFLVKQHHIRTNNINREQQNSKTLRNKQSIGLKWTNAKYCNLYKPTSIRRSKIWTLFPDWWSSCCRRVWVLTEAFLLTEPSTHLDPWTQLHPCRIASFAWVLLSLRLEKMFRCEFQNCISVLYFDLNEFLLQSMFPLSGRGNADFPG